METNNDIYVVGLDLGTTKVVAMVGRKTEQGQIQILGYGHSASTGVARGAVINIDKASKAIKAAVEEADIKAGVEVHSVYVGIAGQHIDSRRQRGSKIRSNKDEEITKEEIKELKGSMTHSQTAPGKIIIHVIPQEFILDGLHGIKEDDIVGMTGTNLEANFHIITADEEALKNIRRSIEKAGLELDGFVLEPWVSAMSVLDQDEKQAGVILIDIGGGTTDIAIFKDGVLCHTSVIPLAGNVITKDIQECGNILPQQAEALKVKFGAAYPSENSNEKFVSIKGIRGRTPKEISLKNLTEIIKARMEEILKGVLFEIKNSGCDSFLGGVVLTGGGSKLKYVKELTDYEIGLESKLSYSNEYLTEDSPKELSDPIFATAVGLVMFGLQREEELLEESREKEKMAIVSESALTEDVPNIGELLQGENDNLSEKKKKKESKRAKGVGFIRAKDWLIEIFKEDELQ